MTHDEQQRPERELEDLEKRTEELGDEISDARSKLVDPDGDSELSQHVEGAVGDHPERSDDEPESEGAPKGWG